jgi:hypothetical protein
MSRPDQTLEFAIDCMHTASTDLRSLAEGLPVDVGIEPVCSQNFMTSSRVMPPPEENDEDVEEIDGEQFADDTANKKGNSHRGKSFLPQEDRVTVSGWLNISKDASTGLIYMSLHS